MALTTKSPTTRILALIALCLAMGAFSLRSIDLFSGSDQARAATPIEQSLVNLVEPVAGYGNVRISVHGELNRTILVLLNQTEAAVGQQEQVELIIKAATGFNPEADTLTVTQFAFANGLGTGLSPLQLLELLVLGLASACLTALLLVPARHEADMLPIARKPISPPDQPPSVRAIAPASSREIDRATELAADDPAGTAQLIRQWMDEGGSA